MDKQIPPIDQALVTQLIAAQFPEWRHLPVRAVDVMGWDNRTFRLGDRLAVRLPSSASYAPQVVKEFQWLARLSEQLPLPIPIPVALGKPAFGYPWEWSVNHWLSGVPLSQIALNNRVYVARDLADFLHALRHIDATQGPPAGEQNFHRGGLLSFYDHEVQTALGLISGEFDQKRIKQIWSAAMGTHWANVPVWVHGDIADGNLLVTADRLSAVIDFGQLGVGDPACDTSIAWSSFNEPAREQFKVALGLDDDTWLRGAAWALWKALIIVTGQIQANRNRLLQAEQVIREVSKASLLGQY